MAAGHTGPDAVVFIPGLMPSWEGPSMVDALGERFVIAMERNTRASLRFSTEASTKNLGEPIGDTRMVRVLVSDQGKSPPKALVDLYTLDLLSSVVQTSRAMGTQRKLLELGLHIVGLSRRVIRVARILSHRDKTFRARAELAAGALTVCLMLVGALVLVATLVSGFVALGPVSGVWDTVGNWGLPFAGAILGLVNMLPQRVRSFLDMATVLALALLGYVQGERERDVVVGRLASFLGALEQTGKYQRLHVIGYSLGAVIALDAVFPLARPIHQFTRMDTLVTIGCPADLIRTYWPEYFRERKRLPEAPGLWINFFAPSDLLASNFIEGDDDQEAPQGYVRQIGPMKLPRVKMLPLATKLVTKTTAWSGIFIQGQAEPVVPDLNLRYARTATSGAVSLLLAASRFHQSYWHRTSAVAASVFDTLVQELFPPGEDTLAQYTATSPQPPEPQPEIPSA